MDDFDAILKEVEQETQRRDEVAAARSAKKGGKGEAGTDLFFFVDFSALNDVVVNFQSIACFNA